MSTDVHADPYVAKTWLTSEEAKNYLSFPTTKALYQAVRRGTVPCHRLGARRLRFLRCELDAAMLGRSTSDPARILSPTPVCPRR